MANNRQQRHSLQKRNRRMTRLLVSKGGSRKSVKLGSKHDRAVFHLRNYHAMGGLGSMAQANPIYTPPRKKLKGYQRDHTGKKVA